ncbi:AI-2E family transporter [Rubrobacter calidifluminis]|uniref:AI-2E family transporter n=1 Tax=Rubrobacter calidifluminis TaxID=1392640 RepID=UPI002361975F|nr:AI-2E family transporter [Rubrobacter calidifluminis]
MSWLRRGAPLAVPVLVAGALVVLYELIPVLELLAISAILALILRSLVLLLGRFGIRSWEAVLILLGLLAATGVFIWLVMLPHVAREVVTLARMMPSYISSLDGLSRQLHARLDFFPNLSSDLSHLQSYLMGLLGSVPALLGTATHMLIDTIAVVVLSLYMAHDPSSLIRGIARFVPDGRRHEFYEIVSNLEGRLRGWLIGLILAIVIIGTGAGVGLWALGIPLSLTLGILAGLLEIIPYFGPILGGLLPALLALTISPLKMILVVLLFFALNQFDSHVVQPLIVGREVRLHPVAVIVSFLVFGKLLGLAGVLLAIPAAAFIVTLADELMPERKAPCKGEPGDSETEPAHAGKGNPD